MNENKNIKHNLALYLITIHLKIENGLSQFYKWCDETKIIFFLNSIIDVFKKQNASS